MVDLFIYCFARFEVAAPNSSLLAKPFLSGKEADRQPCFKKCEGTEPMQTIQEAAASVVRLGEIKKEVN